MPSTDETQELTVSEAGRRGGRSTSKRHGREFYATIGKKGGATTRDRYGSDFYVEIAKIGGATTAARHGGAHYRRIGALGGERVRELLEKGKAAEADGGDA
jgi:general stress protein YciG